MQVDFGIGRLWKDHTATLRRTHIFLALEHVSWRLGGGPKAIVMDNAGCAILQADWYDPGLHLIDLSSSANTMVVPFFGRRHQQKS